MDNNMLERAKDALLNKKRRSIWHRIVSVLGCVVVFCTTYALILPAITMTRETICGLEEHAHTQECYETRIVEGEVVLSCDLESLGIHAHEQDCYDENHVAICGYANYVVHVHDDNCYADGELVCQLQKIEEHIHDAACYESQQKLACGLEEGGETHTHDDGCYTEEKTLVCTEEEGGEIHAHGAACYTEEKTQICTKEEGGEIHVHDDSCYTQQKDLTCGQEEAEGVHSHTDECYTVSSNLTCGKEEKTEIHTHNDDCYNITSKLTCTKEEVTEVHTHGDACYSVTSKLTCGKEEVTEVHTHSDSCYEAADVLVCRKTEVKLHTHKGDCFETREDGTEVLVCSEMQVSEHVHSDSCFIPKTETVTVCGLESHAHVDACYPTEPEETEEETTEATEEETTEAAEDESSETSEGETSATETTAADVPAFFGGDITTVASGTCGENLIWAITDEAEGRTLTISGTGPMENYSWDSMPWYDYCESIYTVVVDEGVTSIGDYAFRNLENMTSISLPEGLTSIGDYAFDCCDSLKNIELPESVTSIGDSAFAYCYNLTSIELPESLTSISSRMFTECVGLVSVSIPESVTSIGESAFVYCYNLPSIELPENLTSIGSSAFNSCYNLTSVNIPDSVSVIGGNAFQHCSALVSVDLPEGFVTIESRAFANCEGLDSGIQTLFAGYYYIDQQGIAYLLVDGAAYVQYRPADATPLENIVDEKNGVEYAVTHDPRTLASGTCGENLTWVIVEQEGVRTLTISGTGAMEYYDGKGSRWSDYQDAINVLIIEEGMTEIASDAFSALANLTSVQLPESLTSIGNSAFASCWALTSIDIPDSVTSIGSSAFAFCNSLTSVDLPTGQVTFAPMVFGRCNSLDSALVGLADGTYTVNEQDIVYKITGGYAFVAYCPADIPLPETMVDDTSGEEYPVMHGTFIKAGTDGEVEWMLVTRDGIRTLVIYGEGKMSNGYDILPDYYGRLEVYTPWWRDNVQRVEVMEGVTSIAPYAFYSQTGLSSVEIADTVTTIGEYSFSRTALTNIEFPEGLTTIEPGTFIYCNFTSLEIPDTVTSIGYEAFSDNEYLTSIDIPDSVTTIDGYAFNYCRNLESVDLPTGHISIGERIFGSCSNLHTDLQNLSAGDYYITEQDGIYRLAAGYAFEAYLPEGVSRLDVIVDEETGSEYPVVKGSHIDSGKAGADVYWVLYGTETENVLLLSGSGDMDSFENTNANPWYKKYRKQIDRVKICKGITSIGAKAFYGCSNLKDIDIPRGVTYIGNSAFHGCESLEFIEIPDSVVSIGSSAFMYCYDLRTIDLPEGLSAVAYRTFYYCDSLQSVNLPSGVTSIGGDAFYGCTSLASVNLPNGLTTIGNSAFYNCDRLEHIDIPDSVTSIGSQAFYDCTNLKSVNLSKSVTAIEASTFAYCSNLVKIEIPEGVTSIGSQVFSGCYTLETVILPESLTSIGYSAFNTCKSLKGIHIPAGVTKIEDSAFFNCYAATRINLPVGFVSIGQSSFSGCTKLTESLRVLLRGQYYIDQQGVAYYLHDGMAFVQHQPEGASLLDVVEDTENGIVYPVMKGAYIASGTIDTDVKWVLYGSGGNECLYIYGNGDMQDYQRNTSAPWYSKYSYRITSIEIADGITSIGDNAFYGCTSVKSVTIPESVTTIGQYAFDNCISLTDVKIPEGIKTIEIGTFRNCSSLKNVVLPDSLTFIDDDAFKACTSLSEIELPAGITQLGWNVFRNCTGLKKICLNAAHLEGCNSVFQGCSGSVEVVVGTKVDILDTCLFMAIEDAFDGTISVTFEGRNYFTTGNAIDSYLGTQYPFLGAGNTYYVDENGGMYLVENGMAYYLYSPVAGYVAPETIPTEDLESGNTYPVYSTKLPDAVKNSNGLTWFVYEGKDLIILGDGDIPNYSQVSAPWYSYRSSIRNIILADTITAIGDYAFNGFSRVTEVEIPRDTANVSTYAFTNCASLRNILVDTGNTSLCDVNGILYNADQTRLILCPPAKRSANDIPATVEVIGSRAFFDNDNLTSVTLPESLQTIEAYAFHDCGGLKALTIPGVDVTVGEEAFSSCENLATVRITAEKANINKSAFDSCSAMTSVTIESESVIVGEYVFQLCESLQTLDIRSNAVELDAYAFSECQGLEQISFVALPERFPQGVFSNCTAVTTFSAPAGYTVIETDAFNCFGWEPLNKVKTGMHYLDEQGALYWICDGMAYYVGCPDKVEDYQLLSQTPKIGERGPYPVDSDNKAGDFLDYGTFGDLYWYIVDDNNRQTLVITGTGEMPNSGYPWKGESDYSSIIDDIVIEDGVKSISANAFSSMNNVTSVSVADSVTYVGEGAFKDCKSLKELIIPEGVEAILASTFEGCSSLASITIPDTVTIIAEKALRGTGLRHVEIPDSVTSIGMKAFDWCTGLQEIVIPNSVKTIGEYAFIGCSSLKNVTISDSVTSIGSGVFNTCTGLTEITIPESVTGMGNSVFADSTSLVTVNWPKSLTSIPNTTFHGCTSLKEIALPETLRSIGQDAFSECSSLTNIEIPESVTVLGNTAFRGCSALTQITVPGNGTVLGHNVFAHCTSLVDVTLCEGVKSANTYTFTGCTSLERVTIPGSMSYLPAHTFIGCTNLKSVTLQSGTTSIGPTAFKDCSNLEELILPEGYIKIDATALQETALSYLNGEIYTDANGVQYRVVDGKAYVVFQPENVTDDMIPDYIDTTGKNYPVVKDSAVVASGKCGSNLYWEIIRTPEEETLRIYGSGDMFNYNGSSEPWKNYRSVIDAIVVEDGATSIGNSAFINCSSVKRASIPEGLVSIGSNAFYGNSSLTEITIPGTVESIGGYSFENCTNLQEITIPGSVKTIGGRAFRRCSGLTSVVIEEGVQTIGDNAFYGCTALKEIVIPGTVTNIGDTAFQDCTGLAKVVVQEGVQTIGTSAFSNCTSLVDVTLPNSVTSIGDQAFMKCSFTEFVFPEGVTSTGGGSFEDCRKVTTYTFAVNMTSLGRTFYGNTSLNTIHLQSAKLSEVNQLAFHHTGAVKRIIVEPGVDILYSALFDNVIYWNSKPAIEFVGPNHFTIDPDFNQDTWSTLKGEMLDRMIFGGSYYVDAQGVLYQVADGAATLLYVPAGLTEYTVPGAIPAADEGEETIPVVGVATRALDKAAELTALVFEKPEDITDLAEQALAYCPTLMSVNGKTTVSEAKASFTNENLKIGEELLLNTGLTSELDEWLSQRETSENTITVETDGIKLVITTNTEENETTEGNMAFYTGQHGGSSVYFTRMSETSTESVRVFLHFSNPQEQFGLGVGSKSFNTTAPEGAEPYAYELYAGKLPYTNTYYLDMPPLKMGHTVEIPVPYVYVNGTEGGELKIWAEVIENEAVTLVSDVTQKLSWETEPYSFKLEKFVEKEPKFIGDGNQHSSFAIHNMSYTVKLSPVNADRKAPSSVGHDPLTRVDFVDVLTFPESENGQKLRWADGVVEAVANGEWVSQKYTNTNGGHIGWQVALHIDGQLKTLLAVRDTAVTDLTVSLTENGDIAFGWTKANSKTSSPNPTFTQYVDVGEGMIVGESINDLNETKAYELLNHVSAAQYFSYSDRQDDEAQVSHKAATNAAELTAAKTADRGKTAYLGEDYPYAVTLENTGTQHMHALKSIKDDLPEDLYITPENMFQMFMNDRDGAYLTITISEATVYNQLPEGLSVTGTDGKTYYPDIQNTSITTVYHGMETQEEAGSIVSTGAKLVLKRVESGISVSLNGGEPKFASSGNALKNVLFELGYFVTPLAKYNVTWEFPEGSPMWSGEKREYKIRSTVKDAFMAISWDHTWTPIWDGADPLKQEKTMNKNSATVSYVLSEGGAEASMDVEVKDATTLKRDFWVDTEYWTGDHDSNPGMIEGGGMVNLCVSVDHDGPAKYDMVPFVSHMTGAQILAVRVMDNPHLAAENYGLTVRTIGGIDYFLLDKTGEYPNVTIGGYLVDCVKVTVNESNPNDITTQMRWYLTNIQGNMEMHIDCKVLMVTNGEIANSSVFSVDNEVWLNDHQTHRLWSSMGGKWSFASFDKQIVTNHEEGTTLHDVVDEDDETILYDGDTVTYRLKITGMLSVSSIQAGRTVVVPGTAIYDQLPKNPDPWNIRKIEYVFDESKADIDGMDQELWHLTKTDPETGEAEDDQQYLVWEDLFRITFHETSTVYIYVTLDYPEGAAWSKYCETYGSEMLLNTMYFSGDTESVRHSLDMRASALLVKGVSSTGVWKDGAYYPSTDAYSRRYYASENSLQRIVKYYVTLYNDGNTRLYLDDIQDRLPAGFTYRNKSVEVSSNIAKVNDKNTQEVTYKTAVVEAHMDASTGILRFVATNGKKQENGTYPGDLNYDPVYERYYLLPREALVFSYECFVGEEAAAKMSSTNTVAMAYFDYNLCGAVAGSSSVESGNSEAMIANDGGCDVISDGMADTYGFNCDFDATQWLKSQVRVEKGNIIPGIEKRVVDVRSNLDDNSTNSRTQATFYDKVIWEVTATNAGTTPICDYVLTDVMQQTYDFTGNVTYTINYGSDYSKPLTMKDTLFSVDDLQLWQKDGTTGQYSLTKTSTVFGDMVVTYTPCSDDVQNAESAPAVLAIHFKSAKAAIPEGGEAVLTVTTQNGVVYRTSTYTNTCYITPSQSWSQIGAGVEEEYNGKLSVRNSADIAVDSAYLTASLKEVAEKENTANRADSEDEVNSVVLSSGKSIFTYTLKVQNTGKEKDVMDLLVLIDNLPEVGDHSALRDKDSRDSEFAVWLAENPNFSVMVGDDVLDSGDYTLQFSSKTSFDDKDWAGEGSGWSDSVAEDTRSFRIVLQGTKQDDGSYEGTVVPANTLVTVRFDARIKAEDLENGKAQPGMTAWNSFGYNYSLEGSDVDLASIPGKVGVKLPSVPELVKKLETPDGRVWAAETDQTFSYVIFKQNAQIKPRDLENLDAIQIGQLLQNAGAEFTRVSLTVPAGASESEVRMLKNQHHWTLTDGIWAEGTEAWIWANGQQYVFVELPMEVKEDGTADYVFGTISDGHMNYYVYTHNDAQPAKIEGMNLRRVWNISLLKQSDSKQSIPLAGAWFGLYGAEAPAEVPALPEGLAAKITEAEFNELLTIEHTVGQETATWYLQSVGVSGSDGIILWEDLTEERYLLREIQAPDGYHYDGTIHVAERPEDIIFNTNSMSVVNRSGYEMPQSGGIGTHWNTMAGILLMAASAVVLLATKRRKKGANP